MVLVGGRIVSRTRCWPLVPAIVKAKLLSCVALLVPGRRFSVLATSLLMALQLLLGKVALKCLPNVLTGARVVTRKCLLGRVRTSELALLLLALLETLLMTLLSMLLTAIRFVMLLHLLIIMVTR